MYYLVRTGVNLLKRKVLKGYDLYNLYQYLFSLIMFNHRYKYINNRLLKRYVIYKYLKALGVSYGYKVRQR